jgi:hypothetical protein
LSQFHFQFQIHNIFVAFITEFILIPYPFGVSTLSSRFTITLCVVLLSWFFRQVDLSLFKLLSTPYDSLAFIKSTFLVYLSLPFICFLLITSTFLVDVPTLVGMSIQLTPCDLLANQLPLSFPIALLRLAFLAK